MLLFIFKRNEIQQKRLDKSGPGKAQNIGSDVSELRGPTDSQGSGYRKEKQKSRKQRRRVILKNFRCLQDSVPSTGLLIDNCCHLYFYRKEGTKQAVEKSNAYGMHCYKEHSTRHLSSAVLHCTSIHCKELFNLV